MQSYDLFRLTHFLGLFLLMASLGGALVHVLNGGTRESNRARAWLAASHGVALLLVLVGGFGMLGAQKLGFPGWVHPKLTIWLLMGGSLTAAYRWPALARPLWFALPLLGLVAAWFGRTHGG